MRVLCSAIDWMRVLFSAAHFQRSALVWLLRQFPLGSHCSGCQMSRWVCSTHMCTLCSFARNFLLTRGRLQDRVVLWVFFVQFCLFIPHYFPSTHSSNSPLWFTRRCLDMLQSTWLTTAGASPMFAQEDCAGLTLVCYSSVERAPTSATEPSVQLDIVYGTNCQQTSDSRTCHRVVSGSRWKRCHLVGGLGVQCESYV